MHSLQLGRAAHRRAAGERAVVWRNRITV